MRLALFDLDNTLLAGDSDHSWGEWLCQRGLVDAAEYQARNDAFYADYVAGKLDVLAYQPSPRRSSVAPRWPSWKPGTASSCRK